VAYHPSGTGYVSQKPTNVYPAPTSEAIYTSTSICTTTTCPAYGDCHTTVYPTVITKTTTSTYVAPCQTTTTVTECYRDGRPCHTKETTITLYPITTTTGHPGIYIPHGPKPTHAIHYPQKPETHAHVPAYPSHKPAAPCYGEGCHAPVYPVYPSKAEESPVYHAPVETACTGPYCPAPTATGIPTVYPGANVTSPSPYVSSPYTGAASSVMPKVGAVMALVAAVAIML